jgi:fructokinase
MDVATIVKLSEDDLKWLYNQDEESIVKSWLSRGVELVVVTRAEKGLRAYRNGAVIEVPAVLIEMVDSVGAGDTIGAVLVEGVLTHGVAGLTGENLRSVLLRASKAAAITCSRAGANPPWLEELDRI